MRNHRKFDVGELLCREIPDEQSQDIGEHCRDATVLVAYFDATRYVLMQSIKSNADLKVPPDTYVSVDLRHFREKEIVQDKAKGKLFIPYKKDTDPYDTTAQSIPHKQISEEEIQENIKKMKKKSNHKDFDSTQKDNSNNNLESASWD